MTDSFHRGPRPSPPNFWASAASGASEPWNGHVTVPGQAHPPSFGHLFATGEGSSHHAVNFQTATSLNFLEAGAMPLPHIHPEAASNPNATVAPIISHHEFKPQAKTATKTRRQPNAATWNRHKDNIYKLYITDDKTLESTMEVMESQGFKASSRMYKAKLGEWGFTKYLKKKHVQGIVGEVARRQGRETEVVKDGKQVDLNRVQGLFKRYYQMGKIAKPDESPTTHVPGLIVRTPSNATAHGSPACTAPTHGFSSTDHGWTPSAKTPAVGPETFASSLLQFDGRGLPLSRLLGLLKQAMCFYDDEQYGDAAQSLRTVVCGFRHHFHPTHRLVTDASYALATIHYSNDRPEQAEEVLNWVSQNHSRTTGLWSHEALSHYVHVAEILRTWSRRDQARLLAFDIYRGVRDRWASSRFVPIPKNDHNDLDLSPEVLDIAITNRILAESGDENQYAQQLSIIELWTRAGLLSIGELGGLIDRWDAHVPVMCPERSLQARCVLIRLYIAEGKSDLAEVECKAGRDAVANIISGSGTTPKAVYLSLAIELAFLHLDIGNDDRGNRVLEWTAEHLESRFLPCKTILAKMDDTIFFPAINFFLQAAVRLHSRLGREVAQPWLERALTYSIRSIGPTHTLSEQLEDALNSHSKDASSEATSRLAVNALFKEEGLDDAGHNLWKLRLLDGGQGWAWF